MNFKRYILSLIIIMLFIVLGTEEFASEVSTIAIINLPAAYDEETLNTLDLFQIELNNIFSQSGKYIIVERQDVDKVLAEQKFASKSVEPIVIGKLLGADFFICLSYEKKDDKEFIGIALLDIDNADIVFSMKEEVLNDDFTVIAKKVFDKLTEQLPKYEKKLDEEKNIISVSVFGAVNLTKATRLDYLGKVFKEKAEYTVKSLKGFRLLRRSFTGVASSEIDLSYFGWVKPSDKAIAKYSDITVSIEYKEVNFNGVEFKKTPIQLKVSLGGKSIKQQDFTITKPLDHLYDLLEEFQTELKKILMTAKKVQKEDSGVLARKKEAKRLWDIYKKKNDNKEFVKPWVDEQGKLTESIKKKLDMLEEIIYLDPSWWWPRAELCMAYNDIIYQRLSEKLLYLFPVAIEKFEFLLSHPFNIPGYNAGDLSYRLYKLYSFYWAIMRCEKIREKTDKYDELIKTQLKKMYLFTRKTYLTIPPEYINNMLGGSTEYLFQKGDFEEAKQFYLLLDKIVGEKYYNEDCVGSNHQNCPLSLGMFAFLRFKRFEDAKFFLDLCKKNHPKLWAEEGHYIEMIYYRKADRKKWKELQKADEESREYHARAVDYIDSLMTSPVTARLGYIPEEYFKHTKYFPEDSNLLVYKKFNNSSIYILGIKKGNSDHSKITSIGNFMFEDYKNYLIYLVDNKTGKIKSIPPYKKDGKTVRLTDCEKIDDCLYFTSKEGLLRYNLSTKEEKWYTEKDGITYKFLSQIRNRDGVLWMSTGFSNEFPDPRYALFSLDPKTQALKTYLSKDDYISVFVIDLEEKKDGWYVICDRYLFDFNIKTCEWKLIKDFRAQSTGIKYDNKVWLATNWGLGELSDKGVKILFNLGAEIFKLGSYDSLRRLRVGIDNPIAGDMVALANDGDLLWMVMEKYPPRIFRADVTTPYLLGYNFKTDTWYGPFSLYSTPPKIEVNSDGYLMFYFEDTGMIKQDDLIKIAEREDLVRTSEEYHRMIKKEFEDGGTYSQAIYAILTHQPKDEVIKLLNKATKEKLKDYRAIMWKGMYLGMGNAEDKKAALEVYNKILQSDAPGEVKEAARIEMKKCVEQKKK